MNPKDFRFSALTVFALSPPSPSSLLNQAFACLYPCQLIASLIPSPIPVFVRLGVAAMSGKIICHRVELSGQGIDLEIDHAETLLGFPAKILNLIPQNLVAFEYQFDFAGHVFQQHFQMIFLHQ
ncbi:MAG: hypothetical protein GXP46_08905 [Deferribacteres bacterium]|nr:hypothetical protein [Deferribacteres bacterium]